MDTQTKPERMSAIDRVAALFVSPAKLMENIKHFPAGFIPLAICLLITVLYLPLSGRLASMAFNEGEAELRATYEQMGLDPDVVMEQARAQVASGVSPATAVTTLITVVFSVFFAALGTFLVGKIFKGEATFKQYFSMYAYLQIITALGSVAVTALSLYTRNMSNMLSLAALVPAGAAAEAPMSYVVMALSYFSLPGLWVTALAVVGLKVLNDWKINTAVIAGVVTFFLSIAAGILLAVLPGMFVGALMGA